MFLNDLFESALPNRLIVNSPQFKAWFRNSKVLDDAGNPLPVFHGTGRPDRIGNRFRKSRATAGPMAYFTDDPTVASNYASRKPDTSIDEDDDYDYDKWFKFKVPGSRSEVTLDRAWWFLSQEERNRMRELAPRIHTNDKEKIVLGDPSLKDGPGGYQYTFNEKRGNVLLTLCDRWLASGLLFDDEEEFLKVLKLAGLTTPVIMEKPGTTYPAVIAVYMSIQNPLVSTSISDAVIEALRKASYRQKPFNGHEYRLWDKNLTDARRWFRELLNDIETTGGKLSWTVVPDWATKVLKSFGYDGIKDVGGKNGGEGPTVWIPFEENQVKSAISNTNFNPEKSTITA